MKKLSTTTWKNRNYDMLCVAQREAIKRGLYRPVIAEYGPGGAVGFLLNYLYEGPRKNGSQPKSIGRGAVKIFETVLRRTGFFTLETCEPIELMNLFQELSPQVLYVIDGEQKVIDAVKRLPSSGVPVVCETLDVENRCNYPPADIVIAYNIVERTSDHAASLAHIAGSVNYGGLLSTTFRQPPKNFTAVSEGLYVRS